MMGLRLVTVPRIRQALCAVLVAALVFLGSRSTVEYISSLAIPPSAPGQTEAAAIDRSHKPTRQQDRTTIATLLRLQWMCLSRPELPTAPAVNDARPSTAPRPGTWSSGFDGVQATRPVYLKPCETAPQRQLPPPAPLGSIA